MKQMRLNENIRVLRKKMGLGQEALASRLGVTVQAVSKWETGGSMPDITLLPEIAGFFGVTLDDLYFADLSAETVPQPETAAVAEIDRPAEEEKAEADTPDQQQPEPEYIPHFDGRDKSWSEIGSDLENIGRSISDNISGQMKRLGGSLKDLFSRNDRWAGENRVREDLPDDGVLRVAQFIGSRMVAWEEVKPDAPVRLALEPDAPARKVIVYGSAAIDGDVKGSVSADGDVSCKEVTGAVNADGNVHAVGGIRGNVVADGDVSCEGAVGGSVTADGNVSTGSVGGGVRAEGAVYCGNVAGSVTSDGDVTCGNVMGNVTADGNVTCASVHGRVQRG